MYSRSSYPNNLKMTPIVAKPVKNYFLDVVMCAARVLQPFLGYHHAVLGQG